VLFASFSRLTHVSVGTLAALVIFVLAADAQKVGEVQATDATVQGSVTLASDALSIGNGSAVKAGDHAATIRLTRGGELRVCPGTSLSVNSSTDGNELMLGMSTGAIDSDYPLPASADSVMTPDFRIVVSGPGRARISVTSNARGDTCVRSSGEGSYVVVTELMGNQTYRVKENEQVFFPGAQIDKATSDLPMACGCPPPEPVKRAENDPAKTQPKQETESVSSVAVTPEPNRPAPETPLPPVKPGQVNVQVDAPFVFHGDDPAPDVTITLARVHMEKLPWPEVPAVNVRPPAPSNEERTSQASLPAPQHPRGKGFLRKIGSFFAAIFK
jgi:hypothetical protein